MFKVELNIKYVEGWAKYWICWRLSWILNMLKAELNIEYVQGWTGSNCTGKSAW